MIRKFIKLFLVALCISAIFISCKTVKPTEFGWYQDYDYAKTVAKKDNKNLIVLFSFDDSDKNSKDSKDAIFNSKEFVDALSKDFVLVNVILDQEYVPVDNKKQTAEQKVIERNNAIAALYGVDSIPLLYIATKEGYNIAKLPLVIGEKVNPSEVLKLISDKKSDIETVNNLVADINKASGVEKVNAINNFYEKTDEANRMLLVDLFRDVPKYDPKNESGVVSKYIVLTALSDAANYYAKNDIDKSVSIIEKAANNKMTSVSDKQNAYYFISQLLMSSETIDYEKILVYLKKSYEADTKSDMAQYLSQLIMAVENELQSKTQQAEVDTQTEQNTNE